MTKKLFNDLIKAKKYVSKSNHISTIVSYTTELGTVYEVIKHKQNNGKN